MDKILVVFTGGTIGSRAAGGVIDVAEGQAYELLQRYEAEACLAGSPGAGAGEGVQTEAGGGGDAGVQVEEHGDTDASVRFETSSDADAGARFEAGGDVRVEAGDGADADARVEEGGGADAGVRFEAGSGAGAGVRFETKQPLSILSENLNPSHWQTLIRCLADADLDSYAGVIVTHGSDTLPYTAAMLGYVFADAGVPVVLVAANYPLRDARSNGVRNFAGAVDFIRDARLPGVYAVYGNTPTSVAVHIGTRLTEALPFTDTFDSAYAAPLGWMEGGKFRWSGHPVNPPEARLRAAASRRGVLSAARARARGGAGNVSDAAAAVRFSTEVLYIRPYPGLNYGYYEFRDRKPRAVLHGVYHSATANSLSADGYRSSLTEFAAYCREHDVDLYAAPAKNAGADLYRSADTFMRAGVKGLRQMAVEAALVKLMLAYGLYGHGAEEEREAWLAEAVFFEIHEGGAW